MANVKDDRGRVMCSALPAYSRHLVVRAEGQGVLETDTIGDGDIAGWGRRTSGLRALLELKQVPVVWPKENYCRSTHDNWRTWPSTPWPCRVTTPKEDALCLCPDLPRS